MNPLRKRFAEAIARAYRRAVPGYPPGDDARLGESLLATMRKDARQRLTEAGETITVELTPEQFFAILEALEELPHLRRRLATAEDEADRFWSLLMKARAAWRDKRNGNKRDRLAAVGQVLRMVRLPKRNDYAELLARYAELKKAHGTTNAVRLIETETGISLDSIRRGANRTK